MPTNLTKSILCLLLLVVFQTTTYAQDVANQIKISGTVKDELNLPLPGVSVMNLTSKAGVSTTNEGKFSLMVNLGDSIRVRFVGYVDYQAKITGMSDLNIIMRAADNSLNEVAIVGYGQQKKISLVGAQSSVNVENLKTPVANLSTALSGRISGIVGVQRTGLPGSNTADVWIRGISTFTELNSSSPLIIVDGVQGRSLNAFDPEDISSFTILKDATATAVYGAQGANGVILITTKKGLEGKPSLTFNYNQGYVSFTKTPELANAEQYMNLRNEALKASGKDPDYSPEYIANTLNKKDPNLYPDVNWMKTLFKDQSSNRRFNFSARGGSQTTQYYTSLAYYDETSLLKTDALQSYKADTRFRRYNFTSNVDMNWTKTTKFSMGVQGYITNTNLPGINPQTAFNAVMQTNPVLYPIMLPGNLVPGLNNSRDYQPNPYALLTQTGYRNIFQSQLYSNATINQDFGFVLKGLSARALFSYDTWNSHTINRTRERTLYGINKGKPYKPNGDLNLDVLVNGSDALGYGRLNNGDRKFYLETAVNYDRVFGDHTVSAMLLYNQTGNTSAFADNLTSSLPIRTQGLAGRTTYSYKDRYFAELNFGYNGSENFEPSKRYGFFPSLGLGWVVSSEPFFEPLTTALPFFKLRYSNGLVGSGSGGRRFGYLTIVSSTAPGFTFGNGSSNVGYNGVAITDYGASIVWSESHKQNFGLEFKTLGSKLYVTVDYFKEHRTGVFLPRRSLPTYLGLQSIPFGNLGIIDNHGFDGTVDLAPFQIGKTSWTFNGTFTYNKDKVIENDEPVQPFAHMERRGVNYLSTFGYIADGLFQSQQEIINHANQSKTFGNTRVGDIRYKDLNADGKIDNNDITRIGNGDVPNWTFGFGINVNYKGFYIGAFFQGTAGAQRLLSGDGIIPFNNSNGGERSNLFAAASDRWTVEDPKENPLYPRLAYGNSANKNNAVASTWWVKDVDFLRLKTMDLGYNLPSTTLKGIGVKSARVYMQGVNLFYWSKFKLWDPELNSGNGSVYPNTRTISFGVQASF